jgi:hypothetical protein
MLIIATYFTFATFIIGDNGMSIHSKKLLVDWNEIIACIHGTILDRKRKLLAPFNRGIAALPSFKLPELIID